MNLDLLPALRSSAASLLAQPTAALDAPALQALIQTGIEQQRALRREAKGGGSTLTLNALLDLDMQLRTKVFGIPRETVKSDF